MNKLVTIIATMLVVISLIGCGKVVTTDVTVVPTPDVTEAVK